jgi:DNA-binding NarL/FixJ family response regulator
MLEPGPQGSLAPATPVIRVLAVDDHPLILEGVAGMLRGQPDLALVAQASSGSEAVVQFDRYCPDVTLMDLRLPGGDGVDGVEAIRRIRAAQPHACLLALTSYDGDADIRRALAAGARGYLLKDLLRTQLRDAIRTAARGERVLPRAVAAQLAATAAVPTLTAREQEVLALMAAGLANHEIARRIGRTSGTVKTHVEHILAKLGATDRTDAVTRALRRGILHLP